MHCLKYSGFSGGADADPDFVAVAFDSGATHKGRKEEGRRHIGKEDNVGENGKRGGEELRDG